VNNGRYEITKKVKFSLDKEDLDNRIKELNDATENLRRVREYSALRADVTLQTTSRAAARYTTTIKAVRDYANRLYRAISGGYVNVCHDEHETFLFLRSRSEALEKRQQMSLKQAPVQFSLVFPPIAPIQKSSVSCYITEVKVKHEEAQPEPMYSQRSSHVINPADLFFLIGWTAIIQHRLSLKSFYLRSRKSWNNRKAKLLTFVSL
jgi:hypothetical protein